MSTQETVKDEAARQTIILVFSLAGTIATCYVLYMFAQPDAFKTLKMRAALALKHLAQRQTDWWQTVADNAATAYQRERL